MTGGWTSQQSAPYFYQLGRENLTNDRVEEFQELILHGTGEVAIHSLVPLS